MTKIVSIETFSGHGCIVRVCTDDGLEGYGQTAHSEAQITAMVLHRLVARNYLGRDPFDVMTLAAECARAEYKVLGSFLFRALAGVDTALWDLVGKAKGQPVYQLLGGKARTLVPLYGSSMRRDTTPEQEVDRMVKAVAEHGFRAVKIKIGERNGRDSEPSNGRTSKLVPLLRQELGDDIELSADGNGAYSPGQAVRVGRMLEHQDYLHFEEPVPFWEHDNAKRVTDTLDILVGVGEQEFSLENMRRLVNDGAVDIIQPDVGYIGGITRARQVAEMADLAGIPCVPHSSGRSLTAIFTAHLVTAMPACSLFHEWTIEDASDMHVYEPFPVARDGEFVLSDAPGWGVEVQSSILQQWERQTSFL
ncbi:mandelate racemase/muconate lactonizing enzyme family protein [Microlunatus panaciterrae]|uniref:L-alanine-DL-glutamate epimerase-like enolase superfamily enzyme n=1 Tax=Microlunatus panaciterrae TaxID=400768 RepID=A0ABS2RNG8_9ACTN|nr:mandelate racemase/muconate lactonizing enzyme family protein [Microlunatus panaciterrae]MBM7800522.1 L-alanine-DL-glutamate epimerase-like enolase superfamily enzyme [Microlunatus panaciterrae]